MTYETILVERDQRVGIITLNRPQALNALNSQVMNEVTSAATELDDDPDIGAIIITGSAKAFAAGADIKEMADLTFADAFTADFFATWGKLAAVRTPTIAAVAGYALGAAPLRPLPPRCTLTAATSRSPCSETMRPRPSPILWALRRAPRTIRPKTHQVARPARSTTARSFTG